MIHRTFKKSSSNIVKGDKVGALCSNAKRIIINWMSVYNLVKVNIYHSLSND